MARTYPGNPVTLNFEVRNTLDVLTNAVSVAFKWKIGRSGRHNTGTIPSHPGTGLYTVVFTPDEGGTIFWKFTSITPTTVRNGHFYVERAEFDEVETNYI